MLAISAQPIARLSQGHKDNPGLPCLLASDSEGMTIRSLHLLHESFAKVGKTLAIPANILIDKKGIVRWTHYAIAVMDRPDPSEVLKKVLVLED